MARILVISNLYPPKALGGYDLACADVVENWESQGHRVTVLSGSSGALPYTSLYGSTTRWHRLSTERRAQSALRAELARGHDLISVWNMAGLPLALLSTMAESGVPVVYVIANDWPVRSRTNDPWLRVCDRLPSVARSMLARVSGVPTALPRLGTTGRWLFCSRYMRDHVLVGSADHGPFGDVEVIPFGIDLDDFPLVEPHGRDWDGRLLFVGRLDRNKGIDTVLRALQRLPDATLHIDGPRESHHLARVEEIIRASGIGDRVTIAASPRSELAALYRAADVCVFASEWEEPFGLVPLESMASGTPVIATGTGGSGEFLADGVNALFFRPGDEQDLIRAVQQLSRDAQLRRRLAEAGRETAAYLTIDRFAAELERSHLEVARSSQPAPS